MRKAILSFLIKIWNSKKSDLKSVLLGFILIGILICIPTGYESAIIYQGTEKVKATILITDNNTIRDVGLIRSGEQGCTVRIEQGRFKGEILQAVNLLSGSFSQDKIFQLGDNALVVISHDGDMITSVTMIDHYRIEWEILLMIIFAIFLILFAGPGGLRALQSFVITVLCLWKIMIPYCLNGGNAIFCGFVIVTFLTVIIILFVYGFDRRSLTSVAGSMLGVLTACMLGMIFTNTLKIHGAIMTNSESLLYSGYESLNLTQIFMASIFIGASGAMMDLSVDITSGICEVIRKKPDIRKWEAIGCGMRIGQAAMGTMTTTLLLAYAGNCITQLMVFMAQGTPLINILNYKYIAAEILQTLAGSFALVTVAPFTAVVGGILLTNQRSIKPFIK